MTRRCFAAGLVALLASCASSADRHELGPEWRPLEAVVDRPRLPFISDSALTVLDSYVFTEDLEHFLAVHPPGSVQYEAILRHEQAHALRQRQSDSTALWVMAYVNDADFKWHEEKIGWWFEIDWHIRNGAWTSDLRKSWAHALATRYKTIYGERMISEYDALVWIDAVAGGRWKPPQELVDEVELRHGGR